MTEIVYVYEWNGQFVEIDWPVLGMWLAAALAVIVLMAWIFWRPRRHD
jgi:hypothetical protein